MCEVCTFFSCLFYFLFPQCSGEISYNGHRLDEFVPQKTSAYISQYDLHIAEMTVRETVDFSARCQGVGSRTGRFLSTNQFTPQVHSNVCIVEYSFLPAETDIMMEVSKREKEAGIIPDTEVDAYMKVHSANALLSLKCIPLSSVVLTRFFFPFRQYLLKDLKEVCKQITS